MASFNIGFLALGSENAQEHFGTLRRPGFASNQAGLRLDTYAFRTGTTPANVAISSTAFSNNPAQNISLALFRDSNADGILNPGDTFIRSAGSGGIFQTVNSGLAQGNYIARLTSNFDVGYRVNFVRGTSGANPLAAPEIPVGQISQDLQKRNTISDTDTADNYAFTLGANDSLNINVKELGNKAGDANIRVVQDLNSNGFVDDNEVIAKGVSAQNGNLDSLSGLKGAGDYILQVCQSKGRTQFEVSFDHSAIAA
jgi:uncharacterized protein (DUF2141 family)